MSSRIIRGNTSPKKLNVRPSTDAELLAGLSKDQIRRIEKQVYERGYREGERAGKQAGETMVETTAKQYERAINELATAYSGLLETVERKTVELALEISRKV